jgi:hypothetical protein
MTPHHSGDATASRLERWRPVSPVATLLGGVGAGETHFPEDHVNADVCAGIRRVDYMEGKISINDDPVVLGR